MPVRSNTIDGAVNRTGPSLVAVLPCSSAAEPAAVRVSSLSALVGLDAPRERRSGRRAASASIPGIPRRASARFESSSRISGVLKFASWIARNTRHSLPGYVMRAATTARHAREVALSRAFGAGANGIP